MIGLATPAASRGSSFQLPGEAAVVKYLTNGNLHKFDTLSPCIVCYYISIAVTVFGRTAGDAVRVWAAWRCLGAAVAHLQGWVAG